MKPLRVNTDFLNILPPEQRGVPCAICNKPQARWEVCSPVETPEGPALAAVPACALCFLYESEWGKARGADLTAYLEEVSKSSPERKIIVDVSGRIFKVEDADFILGVIAMTSRHFDMQDAQMNGKAES